MFEYKAVVILQSFFPSQCDKSPPKDHFCSPREEKSSKMLMEKKSQATKQSFLPREIK